MAQTPETENLGGKATVGTVTLGNIAEIPQVLKAYANARGVEFIHYTMDSTPSHDIQLTFNPLQ